MPHVNIHIKVESNNWYIVLAHTLLLTTQRVILFSHWQLFDRMCMALGGRAAEAVVFRRISTGKLSQWLQLSVKLIVFCRSRRWSEKGYRYGPPTGKAYRYFLVNILTIMHTGFCNRWPSLEWAQQSVTSLYQFPTQASLKCVPIVSTWLNLLIRWERGNTSS